MNKEFIEAYRNLSLNNKRNKLSDELMIIDGILNHLLNNFNVYDSSAVKNYDMGNDYYKNEEEMLEFLYSDIYTVEKKLITLAQIVAIAGSNEE